MKRNILIGTLILLCLSVLPVAAQPPGGGGPGGMGPGSGGRPPRERVAETPKDTTEMTEKEKARIRKKLAKAEAKQEKLRAKEAANAPQEDDIVYLFGVSTNLNDTIIYFSEIIPIHYLRLQKKTHFLPYRSEYSLQMRQYLEGIRGETYQTVSIFFDEKRKKVNKRYEKMKRRMADEGYGKIVVLSPEEFQFTKPDFDNVAI